MLKKPFIIQAKRKGDQAIERNENRFQKPVVYIPLAALCCLLWSSAFPLIKRGYACFDIASEDYAAQILFAGVRFTLAGIFTLIVASVQAKAVLLPKSKKTWLHIGILSLAQTAVHYTFFYLALARIEGSAGSIINSAGTFFGVLLSAAVFRSDKLTVPKTVGSILGLCGIVALNLRSLRFGFDFGGEGLMLLAAMCSAASAVFIKKFSQTDAPALLSGWQFAAGGVWMTAAGLLMGGRLTNITIPGVLIVVYLAGVSAAAYTLWSVLLKHNEVSKITVFGFIIPVGGVLLSALLLREKIDFLPALCSLTLVSVGIILVNKSRKQFENRKEKNRLSQ